LFDYKYVIFLTGAYPEPYGAALPDCGFDVSFILFKRCVLALDASLRFSI
jgi:hypothetical protein